MRGIFYLFIIMNITSRYFSLHSYKNSIKISRKLRNIRSSSTTTSLDGNKQSNHQREGIGLPKGYANSNIRYVLDRNGMAHSGLPNFHKPYKVLGIETSCDDTGVAIVTSDGNILSSKIISQHEIHENFGGVFPSLAMEAHKSNIDQAINDALTEANISSINEIDAIGFTKGPGLEICLRVGCRKAQELAKEYNLPLIATHHLEAHCLIARLAGLRITANEDGRFSENEIINQEKEHKNNILHHFIPKIEFPFMALLASGGHTSLLICRDLGEYDVLGGTLDDALGESFDKCARLVGIRTGAGGGAAVEQMARQGDPKAFPLKVPMRNKHNCDFSYAGLKNAFRLAVQSARRNEGLDEDVTNAPSSQGEQITDAVVLPENVQADLCASFQHTAFSHVEDRLTRALDYVEKEGLSIGCLVVVGGVASNLELRRRLLGLLESRLENSACKKRMDLVFPPLKLCTDNGVMPAWAAIEKLALGLSDNIEEQEVIARWPLGLPVTEADGSKKEFKRTKR